MSKLTFEDVTRSIEEEFPEAEWLVRRARDRGGVYLANIIFGDGPTIVDHFGPNRRVLSNHKYFPHTAHTPLGALIKARRAARVWAREVGMVS